MGRKEGLDVRRTQVQPPRGSGADWYVNIRVMERQRILRGWTQAQLARVAHVDPKTLGDLVVGRRRPTFGTVRALCNALDLTLSDVIVFVEDRDVGVEPHASLQ